MVKHWHAWFLRDAASWWGRGSCFVFHLVSNCWYYYLLWLGSLVHISFNWLSGELLGWLVAVVANLSPTSVRPYVLHGAVLGMHALLRVGNCCRAHHIVLLILLMGYSVSPSDLSLRGCIIDCWVLFWVIRGLQHMAPGLFYFRALFHVDLFMAFAFLGYPWHL